MPSVLLSDRDIRAQIASGRVHLDPYAPELIQPASIDVRLDRYFRVFENHRYPHIDPATEQPELTRLVEPDGDDPFVLNDSTITISFAVTAEGSISIGINGSLSDELTHTLILALVPAQGSKKSIA